MNDRNTTQPKQLVLGCGHSKIHRCAFSHPASDFATVDIQQKRMPDVTCDATDVAALKSHFGPQVFQSIIYEYFPLSQEIDLPENNLLLLREFVEPDGYIVHMRSAMSILTQLPENYVIWAAYNQRNLDRVIFVISPSPISSNKQPTLNPGLRAYLSLYLGVDQPESVLSKITISKDFKVFHQQIMYYSPWYSHLQILALLQFHGLEASSQAIEVKTLQTLCESYTPGFFRKHLMGCTQGMKDLNNFLKRIMPKKTILDGNDVKALLDIIIKRRHREYEKFDVSRAASGETSRIFNQLGTMLLSYLAANDAIVHGKRFTYAQRQSLGSYVLAIRPSL